MFPENFSSIGFVARELHLSEVEGVEFVYFFCSNLIKIVFCFEV